MVTFGIASDFVLRIPDLFTLSPRTSARPAHGLAPLEMVLALPMLLLVMALMVNFGAVASRRVDGLVAARHGGWASRSGRDRQASPPLAGGASGAPNAGLQPVVVQVREQHPVIHGPLPMGNVVNPDLLDPTRGMHQGSSRLTGRYPMLRSLGSYEVNSRLNLLDGKWRHFEMGISNDSWRIPLLYSLATDVPWAYPFAYLQAAIAILDPALQRALRPLERPGRDDEYVSYQLRFGLLFNVGPPDEGKTLPRFRWGGLCTFDQGPVQTEVDNLVDRIQGKKSTSTSPEIPGVAKELTRWFIRMYEGAIDALQQLLGTAPPGQAGAIRAEIAEIEKKIETLKAFEATLPES